MIPAPEPGLRGMIDSRYYILTRNERVGGYTVKMKPSEYKPPHRSFMWDRLAHADRAYRALRRRTPGKCVGRVGKSHTSRVGCSGREAAVKVCVAWASWHREWVYKIAKSEEAESLLKDEISAMGPRPAAVQLSEHDYEAVRERAHDSDTGGGSSDSPLSSGSSSSLAEDLAGASQVD